MSLIVRVQKAEIMSSKGVLCTAKRGLFWRYTTPLVHLIICGINASGDPGCGLLLCLLLHHLWHGQYLLSSKLEIREQACH